MSEQNQNQNNRNGGNGNNRNRNGNGNRNGGNRSQGGGQGNSRNRNNQNNRGGNGGGGNAGQQRNELQPPRNRRARKKPLTFWQKCLKAVGLYKEPSQPAKGEQKGTPRKQAAKKTGRAAGGGRVENKGQGNKDGQKPRPQRKKTPPPTKVESPRLYVGNLSYDASEYDLEELFKGVGAVRKVELVYNRHTHKSKGYGFVNMANMEEAERAVEVLHDQPFMGRNMIVNGARSKGPNDTSPGGDEKTSDVNPPKEEQAPDPAPSPTPAATTDIPAQEEVHSLAPDKD